ncbi:alpha/beta fold hydrolase [Azonexus sp. R2A61]|uniref:alpha/beta hydrolase n=1 Tax=Azonexus sp. R2A61 TaxID=2744443 RepID=UPI001F2BD573
MKTVQSMPRHGWRALRHLALLAGLASAALPAGADEAARQLAADLLDRLDGGDYPAAVALMTPQLATALPAERLRSVWESLPAVYGARRQRGTPVDENYRSGHKVRVPMTYERAALNAEIAIDGQRRIAGLLIVPQTAPTALEQNANFSETPLAIPLAGASLPATLTRPAAAGRVPGVVLVHGSGPHDRDESIGPNKPFRDLAHGLARRGVAVLRYEKRSRARPEDFAGDFGIDDETTDDAVAALRVLAGQPGIGPVFVLGHSQGGMLAPRIAERAAVPAGAILWAAPARPVLDSVIEQFERIAAQDGAVDAGERRAIDALAGGLAAIRRGEDPPRADAPLQLPAGYWRSLDAVRAVDDAQRSKTPLLILHGGRDYQVTDADWAIWQQTFADSPRVVLKRYPALNHLGIAGEAPSTPLEYQRPGRVDKALIDDVAAWIKARAGS